MREIKFRAWNISGSRKMSPIFGINCQELWDWCYENKYDCDLDGELMQYTGLKDKNGKEIYEGDIIKVLQDVNRNMGEANIDLPAGKYEISFSNTTFLIGNEEFTYNPLCFYSGYSGFVVEVIGNRFENPELINNK